MQDKNPGSAEASARSGAAGSPESNASPWSPLQRAAFRSVWIALVASNIGTWMQSVGAAWLMTSLTPSPLLVALMQTATSLPIFLVGLPAGTLADLVDRRKLLLVTVAWMLLVALGLGALTLAGLVTAWTLLALTFLLGLGAALNAPAWQAIIPELVDREELPAAVALQAMGFNVARAVGPAIGGLVVAAAGPAAVFLLNAASFLGVLVVLARWRRAPMSSDLPPEDMLGATAAGLRYVRNAPALQAVLVRIGVFMLGASALWALLPVVARYDLGLGASGYGIILGSLGFGAVGGALLLPRLRRVLPIDRLTALATLVFAGATLALAYPPRRAAAGGVYDGGWDGLAGHDVQPDRRRADGIAGLGARAGDGYLPARVPGHDGRGQLRVGRAGRASWQSNRPVRCRVALVGGLAATWRWPLHRVQHLDLTPSGHWRDPELALTPDPADGPVLITVEYRVPAERARSSSQAMDAMRSFRRREGAVRWDLFRDLADPERYLETFVVPIMGRAPAPARARQRGRPGNRSARVCVPAAGGRAGRRAPHRRPCRRRPETLGAAVR